jgi:glyoxylase-like metal-dependent hydrolase (beta-lactamase superfamily II)
MKPINHYVEITPDGNLQLTTAESRAFLHRLSIDGEMISTPGHSDDSVTLVLDEGIAFTGDLTHPAVAEDTPDTAIRESWNRLRAMHVTHIYPGHGPMWSL